MVSLVNEYQRVFKCESSQVAKNIIHGLENHGLNSIDINKVIKFVAEKIPNSKTEYIQLKKLAPDELPRSLQFNSDGNIFIVFNRHIQKSDPYIGKGVSKKVKKAINLSTGEIVARLVFDISNEISNKLSVWEFLLLSKFQNEKNIVKLLTSSSLVSYNSPRLKASYMLKFYNEKTLLESYPSFSRQERLFVMHSILSGLNTLHQKKIIHRDLKLENIFLERDPITKKLTDVVLADFGLSYDTTNDKGWKLKVGSPLYMPPEIACLKEPNKDFMFSLKSLETWGDKEAKNANTFAIDSWSIGIVLFILYESFVPDWKGKNFLSQISSQPNREACLNAISNLKDDWLPEPIDPNSIGHIIWELLRIKSKERLTIDKAFKRINVIKLASDVSSLQISQAQ